MLYFLCLILSASLAEYGCVDLSESMIVLNFLKEDPFQDLSVLLVELSESMVALNFLKVWLR